MLRTFLFYFLLFSSFFLLLHFLSDFDCFRRSSFFLDSQRLYLWLFLFGLRLLFFLKLFLFVFPQVLFNQMTPLVDVLYPQDKRVIDAISCVFESF